MTDGEPRLPQVSEQASAAQLLGVRYREGAAIKMPGQVTLAPE